MRPQKPVAGVILVLMLGGCTGRSADPADVNALAKRLQDSDTGLGYAMQPRQASCVAKLMIKSDLSDEAIKSLREGRQLAPVSKEDPQAIARLASRISRDCPSQ